MTDSPDLAESPTPEDKEESWAAFEDNPAASTESTDDFFKKEALPEPADEFDDEWNDFEFASPPPVVDRSQETVQKSEPSFSGGEIQSTASTSFEAPPQQSANLSVDTLICDLGQILDFCVSPVTTSDEFATLNKDDDVDDKGDEPEVNPDSCSDDHRGLSLLVELLGENADVSVDQKSNDDFSSATTTKEVLTLWTSLRLIEEAAALKYQWGEARSYERHLSALRMDAKLAKIRNPKLPAFAWQLSNSALTPEKNVTSANNNNSINSASVGEQKFPSDEYGTPDGATVGVTSNDNYGVSRLGGGAVNGSVVAPVQFDWNSSGLRNPLCEGVVDSGSMDLDYFSGGKAASSISLGHYDIGNGGSSGVVNAVSTDAWKTDLKLLGLMTEEDSASPSPVAGEISQSAATISKSSTKSASLLDKLMSSNHRTTSGRLIASSESALSNEARRLLDTLPDLSFMVSPVLMFPIREDLGRPDGGDDVQL